MIVQIIRESTIDYPGKFGPLVLTKGCNFKCGFCHNAALNNAEDNINVDEFLKDIENQVKMGWYNGITISGGEPTLYSGLEDFLIKLKKIGLSVKLDSNGTNPEKLKKFLDLGLVDYIAMDIKGPRELYSQITNVPVDIEKIEESIKILSSLPDDKFEFRTTIPFIFENNKPRVMNKKEAEEMAKWIFDLISSNNNINPPTQNFLLLQSQANNTQEQKVFHPRMNSDELNINYNKLINKNNIISEQGEQNNDVRWFLQAFVSRDKENINDCRLSVEELPKDLQKTPDSVIEELKEVVGKYFKRVSVR